MKRVIATFMILAFLWGPQALIIRAEEDSAVAVTEMNQVMTVQQECDARKLPDPDAAVAWHYTEGESAWVTGETADGWYRISYQGQEWYLHKENITDLQIETEEQGTVDLVESGLDEEMEELEVEGKILVEEVERQREEKKRSQVWIIVLVVLVAGICVTGIVSAVKKGKK